MDPETLVARAQWLYRNRRRRGRYLPMAEQLFGEPAFDILLHLFAHGDAEDGVGVASASVAADVSPPTARRWIATLEQLGLAERAVDPGTVARSPLRLTEVGRNAMLAYLSDW